MIISCPDCERACEVPQKAIGKRAVCPVCSKVFTITVPAATVLDDEPAPQVNANDEVVAEKVSDGPAPSTAPPPPPPKADSGKTAPPGKAPAASGVQEGQGGGEQEVVPELAIEETKSKQRPNWMADTGAEQGAQSHDSGKAAKAGKGESGGREAKSGREGWFVVTREGEVGPLSSSQVVKAARAGKIKPKTMLRHSRRSKAIPAAQVKGLFDSADPKSSKAEKEGKSKQRPSGSESGRKSGAATPPPPPQMSDELRELAGAAEEGDEAGLSADELARVVSGGEEGGLSASGLARELDDLEPPSDRRLSASELGRALGEDE